MKTYFITYSDEKFDFHRKKLNIKAEKSFDGVYTYDREWLITTDFYLENKKILDQKVGAGFCLWKPYVILETLKHLENGDVIFYLDSADIFENGLVDFLKQYFTKTSEELILTAGVYLQKNFTKRDCFILMGCDEQIYHNQIQIEAGIITIKKSDKMIFLLNKWLEYCKNEHILTNIDNIYGNNLIGFVEHRYDQSVLTNLAVKYGLNINNLLRQYITCNAY